MKAAALRGALSDRVRSGRVHVISAVVDGDVPSTRSAATLLAGITERRNVLVVIDRADVVSSRSIRNVQGVHLLYQDQLNTYDVLVSDDVIFVEDALAAFVDAALARIGRPSGVALDGLVDGLEIDVDGDGDIDIEVVFDEPVAFDPTQDVLVVELSKELPADGLASDDVTPGATGDAPSDTDLTTGTEPPRGIDTATTDTVTTDTVTTDTVTTDTVTTDTLTTDTDEGQR